MPADRPKINKVFSPFSRICGSERRKSRYQKPVPAFQRLPLHIAEAIARYCVYTRLDESSIIYKAYMDGKPVWTKLYNVSHLWRELALKYFLQDVVMDIFYLTGKGSFRFPRLPNWIDISSVHYSYVRRVNVDFSSVVYPESRIAIEDFASALPEHVVFSSAHRLCVYLPGLLIESFNDLRPAEHDNFYWLSKRIRATMPNLRKVALCDFGVETLQDRLPFDSERKTDAFMSMIIGKVLTPDISKSASTLRDFLFVQNNTGLSSLNFRCRFRCYSLGLAAERSAQTLELLKITDSEFTDVRSVIIADSGAPIVYPRLKRFEFRGLKSVDFHDFLHVDSSVATFPALRYLSWNSLYIFGDDTLFRGNQHSLEHLDIRVDSNLAGIAKRHKVFLDGKYSRLRSVAASRLEIRGTGPMNNDTFTRFVVSFVAAATRHLSLALTSDDIDTISANSHFENVQILNLTNVLPTITDLLKVIKLFPGMVTLKCAPGRIGTEIDSKQFCEYAAALYTQFYPVSRSFRRWNGFIESPNHKVYLAPYALVFSILCTNFAFAYIPSGCRQGFEHKLQTAFACGLYDEHRDKIQRLFKDG